MRMPRAPGPRPGRMCATYAYTSTCYHEYSPNSDSDVYQTLSEPLSGSLIGSWSPEFGHFDQKSPPVLSAPRHARTRCVASLP